MASIKIMAHEFISPARLTADLATRASRLADWLARLAKQTKRARDRPKSPQVGFLEKKRREKPLEWGPPAPARL